MPRRLSLVIALLTVASVQASADLDWLLEHRVRIQSPELGPGWHEGLFNRQRREPPCYVVITWKPRSSPESSLQLGSIIELNNVSKLQAYSGPRAPLSTWAGLHSSAVSDDSLWQLIPQEVLSDNSRHCSTLPSLR